MKKTVIAAVVLAAIVAGAVYGVKTRLPGFLEERAKNILRERFHSDTEFGTLSISLLPLQISGTNLKLRRESRRDVPPLISIGKFEVQAGLVGFLRTPAHVNAIHLNGLQIHIQRASQDRVQPESSSQRGPGNVKDRYPVVVDEITADDTTLEILPKAEGKDPLVFAIHRLVMHSVGLHRSAPFRAALTNPKPKGEIETSGLFGPWQPDDPGKTAVSGKYSFDHADMGTFKGLSGILSSKGRYRGVLERITADGETTTPDFGLTISGHTVPLHTRFHAIIDGTNGDTLLQPVDAEFLSTALTAEGGVVKVSGRKGKVIKLDVVLHKGRMEDLLKLVLKSDPSPLTGAVGFRTRFLLPSGDEDVIRRLRLDGHFTTTDAAFTSPKPAQKLRALSRAGQGKPKEMSAGSEIFDLSGKFRLRNGILDFSTLNFSVVGASVSLHGTYGLATEALDFRGTLRLDAKLSQATTGVKSFVLKVLDPFFSKKEAGAVVPIKVAGTRSDPSIGLAFGGGGSSRNKAKK